MMAKKKKTYVPGAIEFDLNITDEESDREYEERISRVELDFCSEDEEDAE